MLWNRLEEWGVIDCCAGAVVLLAVLWLLPYALLLVLGKP